MPHTLVDTAAEAGTGLLPAANDLDPSCSCPDHGWPCKHVAALCYQMARLLDTDPFVLLLLRGRGERELVEELGRRSAAHGARERPTAPTTPSVPAREALAGRFLPPLPAPLPVPSQPGQPPSYPPLPGARDPLSLDHLATDAAARAHALLTTGQDPLSGLTPWQDAVRLAAARPTAGLTATTRALYRELAFATGRTTTDLARAVAAWRQGGAEGLEVLEIPWDPPAGPFDRARPALASADFPASSPGATTSRTPPAQFSSASATTASGTAMNRTRARTTGGPVPCRTWTRWALSRRCSAADHRPAPAPPRIGCGQKSAVVRSSSRATESWA